MFQLAEKTLWTEEGADHLDYLRTKRRLSDEVIKEMRFGYVPQRTKPYFVKNRLADVSGRIIMPMFDAFGELLVLTTRDLRPDADTPFYHERFEKKRHLFGLHLAKDSIIKHKKVIVVEGQFDAAYLRSLGFTFTVAMLGSALSFTQATLLSRYCSEIYLFFDGDLTGRNATTKSVNMARDRGLGQWGITFVPVWTPEDKDPDEFDKSQIISLCKQARADTIPPS